MRDVIVAITAASYSGNKGAAAMLQSSIEQLHQKYNEALKINLMSVYPDEDREQIPWDFVEIISSRPSEIVFIAFPLAILYFLFHFIPPLKWLLLKNRILKAYKETDLVIDEAGISFVDSRGFVMNTYAFITMAIPLLMKVPVVKYSQAIGEFENMYNRILAKIILPRMKLICARGRITYDNLTSIGIKDNVELITDGAFSMKDNEAINKEIDEIALNDAFYGKKKIVAVSLSSVVYKKCAKYGIDYIKVMSGFINKLCEKGYNVHIIANSARKNSHKMHNNDLPICKSIYDQCTDTDSVRFENKEMNPQELRAYIGKCDYFVGSRFHAMIAALYQKKPVLLIRWSHKYKEILDLFELDNYSLDYSSLDDLNILEHFELLVKNEKEIIKTINKHYEYVIDNSYKNIERISQIIDTELEKPYKKGLLDTKNPDKYIGEYRRCRIGYSSNENIRKYASSGGVVTSYLCYLLDSKEIDGALVTKTIIDNGSIKPISFIVTTKEELYDSSASVYIDFPILKHLQDIREFDGKVAVVMTPCMLKALDKIMDNDSVLKNKIKFKIGLFCGGSPSIKLTDLAIKKSGLSLNGAKRFFYKLGHWRGDSTIIYKDNSIKTFSYTRIFSAYKNAFFFEEDKCVLCQDQYASTSDISFGDIWLKKMKNNPIKHTCIVIRNEAGEKTYYDAVEKGYIVDKYISNRDVVMGQKRSLVYKYRCAQIKDKVINQKHIIMDLSDKSKWNHRLAFKLATINRNYSQKENSKLESIPTFIIFLYMLFIRFLLNF